ncbi:MAG: hypothetical protein GC145_02180 [Caulobacter sp.]|nr:hypothetical protein [Caulobacter sp.]
MIQALSIAGDVFWIFALGIMASMSWAAWKRIPAGTSVPVVWRGGTVSLRAPKLAALWGVVIASFLLGGWFKIESRSLDLTLSGAVVLLGVRVTLAPLLAVLHMTQVRKALETLDREGAL